MGAYVSGPGWTVRCPTFLALALILAAGCSSSLREVRAQDPEFRFAGVASSRQFEVARCIRDTLDHGVGESGVVNDLAQERDGMHVVGRLVESLADTVFFDVAVREEAVVARRARSSVIPAEMVRNAIATCLSETPGVGGRN